MIPVFALPDVRNVHECREVMCRLGYFLTTNLRTKYHDGTFHSDQEFRSVNEVSLRIFQHLIEMDRTPSEQMPMEIRLLMLRELAVEGNFLEEFDAAFESTRNKK
jgi:hypothetical protein